MGEDAPQRRLSLYRYDEAGDLTLAQDENAGVWTYQYQQHLNTRHTDRAGRGMNLEWQGLGADARAVRDWADEEITNQTTFSHRLGHSPCTELRDRQSSWQIS